MKARRLSVSMILFLVLPAVAAASLTAQEPDPPEPPTREEMEFDRLIAELRSAEAALSLDPENRRLIHKRLGALYLVGVQEKWAVEQGLAALDSLEATELVGKATPPTPAPPSRTGVSLDNADTTANANTAAKDTANLEDAALSLAYRGGLTTLLGKHAFWPHSKLGHVRSGLSMLDRAVEMEPASARIRYLRLMSGYYLPGIFGRSDEVRADFAALAGLLPGATADFPPRLYVEVCRFVLENGDLEEAVAEVLRRALGAG